MYTKKVGANKVKRVIFAGSSNCWLSSIFREWYDSHAVLMQEEGVVIAGLLVGLNVIDCNFDLKGDSLDTWVS